MTQRNHICAMTEEGMLSRVKHYIRTIAANPVAGTPTGEVLEDVLDLSGKMIRPRLLLTCAALGADFTERLDRLCVLAALVELTHLSSLIHDDIIDDAAFRRGKPSTQSKYGKDAAVYAGDFLIARIHYWEAKEGLNEAAMRLAATVEDMCVGEVGQALCRYREDVTAAAYYQNIRGKTASLFKSACGVGAAEGGCGEETVAALERFGETVGMVFQLRDDLLDFTATRQTAGKETHKDFRDGIYTLPVLKAMETPRGRAALLPILAENRRRSLTDAELGEMERTVLRFGGVEATWAEIHRHCAEGRALLDTLEDSGGTEKLRRMLYELDKREG